MLAQHSRDGCGMACSSCFRIENEGIAYGDYFNSSAKPTILRFFVFSFFFLEKDLQKLQKCESLFV
jgi:hypothetical protein